MPIFRSGYVTTQGIMGNAGGGDQRTTEEHTFFSTVLRSNKPHPIFQAILGRNAGQKSMDKAFLFQTDFT